MALMSAAVRTARPRKMRSHGCLISIEANQQMGHCAHPSVAGARAAASPGQESSSGNLSAQIGRLPMQAA